MAAPQRYGIYPASFSTPALTFNQIGSCRVNAGANKLIVRPGGQIDPAAIGMAFADPRVSLRSADLAVLLALNTNLFWSRGITAAGAVFQFQQRGSGDGVFLAGTNHAKITAASGYLMPTEISASQDDTTPATMDCEFIGLYDGVNLPLVPALASALTGSPAVNDVFYLASVYVAGAQVPGVRSVRLASGIQFDPVRADGDVWARAGSIMTRDQICTVQVRNAAVLTSIGLDGLASSGAGIAIYLRRGGHGISRASDASSVHLKFAWSGTGADYQIDTFDVDGTGDAEAAITFRLGGVFTVTTTSTIP